MVWMESRVAAPAIKSSLQVENVGMIFDRDDKQTRVLEDISLEVGEGEFVVSSRSVRMRQIDAAEHHGWFFVSYTWRRESRW